MPRKQFGDKRERFLYLAEKRTNAVLSNLRILSNCSNKNLYDFSDEEIDKIFVAIEGALSDAKTKFKGKKKEPFKLQS